MFQHQTLRASLRLALPVAAAAATLSLVGCMIGKTTHTLYLESDGALTWTVEESQMRSAEEDVAERRAEEQAWMDSRQAETHDLADALWRIGARRVETLVARDRRPFHVVTRARFDDPADAIRRLIEEAGLVGEVESTRTHRGGSLTVRIDVGASEAADAARGDDAPPRAVDSLLAGDDLVVMVADGSFVAAVGFDVEDDVARLDDRAIEDALALDPATLRLFLEWELRE